MNEIKALRTRHSKIFSRPDGMFDTQVGGGPVHYNNKTGVGDGVAGWRTIDTTLLELPEGGWTSPYNACMLMLPESSDGPAIFRDLDGDKDQAVTIKAACKHSVKGELLPAGIPGVTDHNCVVYWGAWGKGRHLVYAPGRTTFSKLIWIEDKDKWGKEQRYGFTLILRDGQEVYRQDGNKEHRVNINKADMFDSPEETIIRTKNGDTTIRAFKAWDLHGNISPISVEMTPDGKDRAELTKIIPAEFISGSSGAVFTDATLAYTTSADGSSYKLSATWSGARNAAVGNGASSTGDEALVSGGKPSTYLVSRGLFPYNIGGAGVPITDVVSACQTYFKVKKVSSHSYVADVCLVEWTQAGSPPTIGTGSFNDFGTTLWSDDHPTGTSGAVLNHDFNSAGLAALQAVVAAGGWLKVCCRDYTRDYLDAAPSGGYPPWNTYLYTSESAGYDPYLTITHAPPPAGGAGFFGMVF